MASSRERDEFVILRGNDLQSLKEELGRHLGRAMQRQKPDVIVVANKVPLGFCGLVDPGCSIHQFFPFPVSGTLQDFVSKIPDSCKDLYITIEAAGPVASQVMTQRLMDGYRDYTLEIKVPDKVFCKVSIENRGKQPYSAAIGFTYRQGKDYEIKEIELTGTI